MATTDQVWRSPRAWASNAIIETPPTSAITTNDARQMTGDSVPPTCAKSPMSAGRKNER